jgi:hypothetical protein
MPNNCFDVDLESFRQSIVCNQGIVVTAAARAANYLNSRISCVAKSIFASGEVSFLLLADTLSRAGDRIRLWRLTTLPVSAEKRPGARLYELHSRRAAMRKKYVIRVEKAAPSFRR